MTRLPPILAFDYLRNTVFPRVIDAVGIAAAGASIGLIAAVTFGVI